MMWKFCSRILYFLFNANVGLAYRFLTSTERVTNVPNDQLSRKNLPRIKDIPYHVLVVYTNLYCSGSLITSKIVVTAATCLHKYSGNGLVKVGSDTITGFGQVIPVQDVKIHEYFRHKSVLDNDIALVVLKTNVAFSGNVEKVLLIEPDTALYDGTSLSVSGWGGNNQSSPYANLLLVTEMVVLDKSECQEVHGSLITESNFCASYNNEQRLSDNGGGATYNSLLVGVLLYGPTKAEDTPVAIFTNISYFHRWLKVNSLRLLRKYCYKKNQKFNSLESNEYNRR